MVSLELTKNVKICLSETFVICRHCGNYQTYLPTETKLPFVRVYGPFFIEQSSLFEVAST